MTGSPFMATVREATHATIDDLSRTPGKAELVDGQLVLISPTGIAPGRAAIEILFSLRSYIQQGEPGCVFGDNVDFIVELPNRRSFSPDVAYCIDVQSGMQFYQGAPTFAVEIRSENDYGPSAERAMAAKRADYFAAGTLVVWDVDLLTDEVVRAYRATARAEPTIYGRADLADAEPAVVGWTMAVADIA